MLKTIVSSLALTGIGLAGVKSGHAEANLLVATKGYTVGQPLQLGVRLKMDAGWHSYWVNPGEGGMEMSVDWKLPEGWSAGPLLYPVPIRFMTGELPGFGYEDEVIIPVRLMPAEDAKGQVEIGVELSWLTCDDTACVPGDAELKLSIGPGGDPTEHSEAIFETLKTNPRHPKGSKLEVQVADKSVTMKIHLPEGIDATGATVFPATPGVADLKEVIRVEKTDSGWQAIARDYQPMLMP